LFDDGKEGTWSESGEDERENDGENDGENDDDEHINIEDLVIYEDDSDETIDSKMKKLIQLSKNYEFSFPCVKLNKRQRCLIHQTVGTHFIISLLRGFYTYRIENNINHYLTSTMRKKKV
jgi:hypothetical protein